MQNKIACAVLLLWICAVAWADHGGRRETSLEDGGLVISTSWKSNYLVYRSIGGETTAKGKETKRKWWCAWLCKQRVGKKAQRIQIANTYFSEVSPGVFASLEREPKVCTNAESCKQNEWAVGVGIKLNFPNGGSPSPGQVEGLLPVDGVITRHIVQVDDRTITATTSAGKHPAPIIR